MIFERQFFTLHFLQCNYIWDINHDYVPEAFATWEEQKNNFAFDNEKEKYVKEKSKKFFCKTRLYFHIISLFKNNWISSSV